MRLITKGEVFILRKKVSATIERAMFSSHNMSFPEYVHSLDKKMEVEKRREQEYRKAKQWLMEAGV
ncbi:hypothetical protein HMPREF9374_3332 [Desmospora sp. 8437]|nr:hypothetical protein HMPREF9374_3332 [Desmospora sp. 8437]